MRRPVKPAPWAKCQVLAALAELYDTRPSLLGGSEALKEQWSTTYSKLLAELYRLGVSRLGEKAAADLFGSATKRGKGQRGRGKASSDRNAALLEAYDKAARAEPEQKPKLPGRLARRFAEHQPKDFGRSPDAIEKRLRRLLKESDIRNDEINEQFEWWREEHRRLFGTYPPPSLIAVTAGKTLAADKK